MDFLRAGPTFRARESWAAGSDPSMCSNSRLASVIDKQCIHTQVVAKM